MATIKLGTKVVRKRGAWRWVLIARNGTQIATSDTSYATKAGAVRAARSAAAAVGGEYLVE